MQTARRWRCAIAFVTLVLCGPAAAEPAPTETYGKSSLHGWTIRVASAYRNDDQALDRVMGELNRQLANIVDVVPAAALTHLRRTVFWLEYRREAPDRARYHRSAAWLEKNGFNPDKAKGVEIDFGIVTAPQRSPWSLMHELTHAYFDGPLGRKAPALEAAYENALAARLYDNVMRNTGRKQQAYAMNSPSEYFAELSEAYFGENDFEPFTREQLRQFDPAGYAAVRDLWGHSAE